LQIGEDAMRAVRTDHHVGKVDGVPAISWMVHNRCHACSDLCAPVCLVHIGQPADPAQIDFPRIEHPFALVPGHAIDPMHGYGQFPLE
jgi:hypothetical protein